MATTDPVRRVRAYLASALGGTKVATEVPSEASKLTTYVVVNPNGGVETDFLDIPSLLMDCHAATDVHAYDLARRVAALMRAMPDSDPFVSSVSTDAPYRNSWARSTTPAGHCYSVPCDMTINK